MSEELQANIHKKFIEMRDDNLKLLDTLKELNKYIDDCKETASEGWDCPICGRSAEH